MKMCHDGRDIRDRRGQRHDARHKRRAATARGTRGSTPATRTATDMKRTTQPHYIFNPPVALSTQYLYYYKTF